MENIFALVYVEYEGLKLLEIGNRDFIFKEYNERIKQRRDFEERFKNFYDLDYDFYDAPEDENEQQIYINHKGRHISKMERLCIMGYKDNAIECVCKDFGIDNGKIIWY